MWPSTTTQERAYLIIPLGQIASYLHSFKVQYGFITTYNYTIFLWFRHYSHHDSTQTADTVQISRPIPHDRQYIPRSHPDGPKVTIRQGIWYLMCKADAN